MDTWQNVVLFLTHHPEWKGVIWLDEFSNRIVKRMDCPIGKVGELDPGDGLRIGMWLSQQSEQKLLARSEDTLQKAIKLVAQQHKYHPVREWIAGLKWDGESRLDTWIGDWLGIQDSPYVRLVARFWAVAMVARVFQPGCTFKFMPILCGEQNIGKSRAMGALGGQWFADTPFDMRDKDSFQVLRGKWLYEMSELDAFNRAESTRAKSYIGSPSDNYRASYDSGNRDWPRQTVFVGTTNQHHIFKDATGNVRYWPLDVEEDIRVDLIEEFRGQLFAEAFLAYNDGARYVPTRQQEREFFMQVQEEHEQRDPWLDLIEDYCVGKSSVTVVELLTSALGVEKGRMDDVRMVRRIQGALRKLGWQHTRAKSGTRQYIYERPRTVENGVKPPSESAF